MVELGNEVKDIMTGFSGIAVARTDWLFGCSRILIEPTKLNKGNPIEAVWYDEQRVQVVKKTRPKVVKQKIKATSGGPQKDPVR